MGGPSAVAPEAGSVRPLDYVDDGPLRFVEAAKGTLIGPAAGIFRAPFASGRLKSHLRAPLLSRS